MKQIEPQAELGKQGLLPDAYQSFDLKPIPSDSARPRCQQVSSWLRLREQLDAAAWLEVRYEDLVQDLPTAARRALAFLKLSWEEAVLGYRDRLATKTVHSPTYLDVAQPIHRRPIGRWKNYARWLAPQWVTSTGLSKTSVTRNHAEKTGAGYSQSTRRQAGFN